MAAQTTHSSRDGCHTIFKKKKCIIPREQGWLFSQMDSHSDSIKNMTDVLLPNCLCLWFISLACDTSGGISLSSPRSLWEFLVVDPPQQDRSLPSAAEGPILVPPWLPKELRTPALTPQEPLL